MLGWAVSEEEAADVLHLWRYVGRVMGVDDDLLCAQMDEARDLFAMIEATQEPPDEDSRLLARSLIENSLRHASTEAERDRARKFVSFAYGVSRHLLGDRYADALGYPSSSWPRVLRVVRPLLRPVESLRRAERHVMREPPFGTWLERRGMTYWSEAVRVGLADGPPPFALPDFLAGARERRRPEPATPAAN
jgi:hypothetical protein